MTQVQQAVTLFLSLFLTALPFLLLGILISSVLLVFVNEHQLAAKFPQNPFLGAIVGSSLGIILPVCQYGNIPVTRRLLLQGVPLSVAIGFLMAAPTINPIAIWLTWKAFHDLPSMVLYRVLLTWLAAVGIGCLFSFYREKTSITDEGKSFLETRSTLLKSGSFLQTQDSQPLHRVGNLVYEYKTTQPLQESLKTALPLFLENFIREGLELGSVLAIGCAIAAIVQFFLPPVQMLQVTSLYQWGGQTSIVQILFMMLSGVILSVGSPANVFFPAAFMATFLPGSLLAFLLFSSIVDLKSLGLMFVSFRPKVIIYCIILMALLTIFSGLILNFYVNRS